jgi:hypothetical protein
MNRTSRRELSLRRVPQRQCDFHRLLLLSKNTGYWRPLAIVIITVSLFPSLSILTARAEPINFQFKAMISEIAGDASALNLPFALNVGQQIHGKYSFQSEQDLLDIFVPRGVIKEGVVHLAIDGSEMAARTNFGLMNSGPFDISAPPPGPNSSLFLGYISETDVIPGWGGLFGVAQPWGASLALVGNEGIVSVPEDVLNVATWNELKTLRRLSLQFGYPNTVTVQATVAGFHTVPEPTNFSLLSVLIVVTCNRLFQSNMVGSPRRGNPSIARVCDGLPRCGQPILPLRRTDNRPWRRG